MPFTQASRRRDKPLIKLNCAALPPGLVESELFGHEKGAFSGAISSAGWDDSSWPMAARSSSMRSAKCRWMCSSNCCVFFKNGSSSGSEGPTPSRSMCESSLRPIATSSRRSGKGSFERTCFTASMCFRSSRPRCAIGIGDVPLLVQFFVAAFSMRVGVRIEAVGQRTMERLVNYRWPGNIRELENVLERAIILSDGPTLEIDPAVFGTTSQTGTSASQSAAQTPHPVAAPSAAGDPPGGSLESLEEKERSHILAALGQTGWVIEGSRGAATILAIHPNTLRSRMKKLGISRPLHGPQDTR